MATHVGDIFFDAKINRKEYDKGLKGLSSSAGALTKKIGALFAVGTVTKFVKSATQAGASLNAMGTIIDASLPNMTEQVNEFAKSAGALYGLSETQAKGFVGKFASMASAMGYTEKQAYDMSTALTGLAGDVASYYHISQDEAYAKLGAVFTGETESLKQLGVVMTQNALDAYALEHGYGKVTNQMSELEKTTLRYQFVMDSLKLANGDFAKYANTWSGSLATLKLNWSNFMATVGQGMINILLPLLQLISKLSNALTALGARFLAWSEKVTGKAKKAGTAVKNALGDATQKSLENSAQSMGDVGEATDGVNKKASKAKKSVQALKRELLGFDQITKLTKQDKSTGTTGDTGTSVGSTPIDVSDVDTGTKSVSRLGEAVDYLSKIKLPPALTASLELLRKAVNGLLSLLSTMGKWVLKNVLEPLGAWMAKELAPAVIDVIAGSIKVITNVLKVIFEILKLLWKPILKPMFTFLGDVAVASLKGLAFALELVATFFGVVAEAMKGLPEKFQKLKEKWEEVRKSVAGKVLTFKTKLEEGVKARWESLAKWWEQRKVSVKTFTADFLNKVKEKWEKFKKWWDKIKEGVKTYTVKFGFVDDLKDAWNNLVNLIQNARSTKVGKALLPDVPYLAQGGYVKANTPQMAVIGDNKREGEIVAPESKLRAMAQEVAGASNTQTVAVLNAILQAVNNIDPNVYLDGESIKKNTVRRINQHTRTTGQLEIIV